MKIETLVVGPIEANCYILSCPLTKEAVVIDPGDDGDLILEQINKENLQVKYILNTHGHFDHVGANDLIREATKAQVAIHVDDHELILDPKKSSSSFYAFELGLQPADLLLRNNDKIAFGQYALQVIYTPGHSKGGCCFYEAQVKACFTGDTLFKGTVGRTDLYGGDYVAIIHSVKKRLSIVPDETTIYPGHGPATTMKIERRVNPYVK